MPNRQLSMLLSAWMLACTGGWAFSVTVAVYAFHMSGVGGVGAVAAARLLPAAFAAPVTGGLLDRMERTRVVALAAALQTLCLGLAAELMLNHGALLAVVVLAGASGAAATATRPGLEALMPALAESPDELTHATAWWSAVDSTGFLIGGGVAGIAIAAAGVGAIAVAAAVLLFGAALIAARLPAGSAAENQVLDEEEGEFAGALAGLRAVLRSSILRVPFGLFAGLLLLEGTTDVQLVALALGKLRLGNGGPGLLYGVWGAGGLLGSVAILALVRRRGYGLALTVGALGFGAGLASAGVDGVALALAAMVAAGIGFSLVETSVTGLVPRLADDRVIGRVYALSELLYAGAAGLGALIAPALVEALGVAGSLIAVGIAFASFAALALRSCARLDVGQEQAGRVRELLRHVGFLAPLPLPQLERLVRRARSVLVPAGVDVIRIGDPGEDFFVIEHGSAEVAEYKRRQGPGDGFGEIALLRDVPRTATVRAVTDLQLWAIGRPTFIAAVLGHGDATALADAIVAERLARERVNEARMPG